MPREIYDPKKPELEFYNKRPPRVPKPIIKHKTSLFAKRWFVIVYGIFLTALFVYLLLLRFGIVDRSFITKLLRSSNSIYVRINHFEIYNNSAIATFEVRNINYTNSSVIKILKTTTSIYNYKKERYRGNNDFYNVKFPSGQRIGFKVPFDYNTFQKSNRVKVVINLDDSLVYTKVFTTKDFLKYLNK